MRYGILKHASLVILIFLGMTANAFAVGPGFYLGMIMGPGTNNGSPAKAQIYPLPTGTGPAPGTLYPAPGPQPSTCSPTNPSGCANTTLANPQTTQFGTDFLLGYKFNSFAGFEMDFNSFSGVNFKLKPAPAQNGNPANPNPRAAAGTTYRARIIAIMGKLDYSFRDTVGVFGKAGIAGAYMTTPGALNITNWSQPVQKSRSSNCPTPGTRCNVYETPISSGTNTYTTKAVPAFAVGVSYDLNQNWVMDASATTYLVSGVIGRMTMYGIGLSYHLVDVYCGQFLC